MLENCIPMNDMIVVIICAILLLAPSPILGEQIHQQTNGLEPSRTLLPTFHRDEPSHYGVTNLVETRHRDDKNLDDFNVNLKDTDLTLKDSCKFLAVSGRLFNQSLQEEIERLHPSVAAKSKIKINLSNLSLSPWLIYDHSRSLLQGVPLTRDIGSHDVNISVRIDGRRSFTRRCFVEVESEGLHSLLSSELHLRWRPGSNELGCLPNEPVVNMALWLDANKQEITAMQRVNILHYLCNFVSPISIFQAGLVAMQTEHIDQYNAFLSGHGNSKKSLIPGGIAVYWPLGCGADSVDVASLEQVEAASQNGSIAQAIGFDVMQWRVENRKPKQNYRQEIKRYKRQLDSHNFNSPALPHSSSTPGFPDLSNTDEKDLPLFDSDAFFKSAEAQKKVLNYMFKNSPGIIMPAATPVFKAPLERSPMPVPSSPRVESDPTSTQQASKVGMNQPPERVAGIDNLQVHGSTYFEYQIPRDAFHDQEDGDTQFLHLTVVDISSSSSDSTWTGSSWLLIDSPNRILYGTPPKSLNKAKKASPSFLILAEDSEGKSATANFVIHVSSRPRPINHRFTLFFTARNHTLSATEYLTSLFLRRLTIALQSVSPSHVPPGIFTVHKIDRSSTNFALTWFDNSLGSKRKCNRGRLNLFWSQITGMDEARETKHRVKPTSNFASAFLPDFTLKSTRMALLGPCKVDDKMTTLVLKTKTTSSPSPPELASIKETTEVVGEIFSSTSRANKEPTSSSTSTKSLKVLTTTTSTTTAVKKTTTLGVHFSSTTIPTTKQKQPTIKTIKDDPAVSFEPPILIDPSYIADISTVTGKESKVRIDHFVFVGGDQTSSKRGLQLQLRATGHGVPPWIATDSSSWSVIALPTASDTSSLVALNTTHSLWTGGLVAVDTLGRSSEQVTVRVIVKVSSPNKQEIGQYTHMFEMLIENYNLLNFTALESDRLMNIIRDLYKDPNLDNIYVHPLRKGSVVFSWHNVTLTSKAICPYKELSKLGGVVFESGNLLRSNVYQRFVEAGFSVKTFLFKKMNVCLKRDVKPVAPSPTTSLTVTTGVQGEEIGVAGAGGTTSIIIIVVVIVCCAVLLVITVVKCRMSNRAGKKQKEKKSLQASVTTTAVPPSSPFLLQENAMRGDVSPEQKLHFKPGTPIVFDGEAERCGSMVSDPLLNTQQTSFITPQMNSNGREGVAGESTHLADAPPDNEDDVRPPPPPYIPK